MTSNQALVTTTHTNGNGLAVSTAQPAKPTSQVPPLTEELVDQILKGRDFRGWLRAAKVARVLGLFSFYLFLDTYDIRADFKTLREADDHAWYVGLETSLVMRFKVTDEVKLNVSFLSSNDISRRNIE